MTTTASVLTYREMWPPPAEELVEKGGLFSTPLSNWPTTLIAGLYSTLTEDGRYHLMRVVWTEGSTFRDLLDALRAINAGE